MTAWTGRCLFILQEGTTLELTCWHLKENFIPASELENYGAPNFFLLSTPLAGGWKFVGATYERSSGEAKLWVNGVAVQSTNMGAGIDLGTQSNAQMGASIERLDHFKGRIAQMRVYDVALTQEQIQEIYGKNVFFLFSYRKIINVGKS